MFETRKHMMFAVAVWALLALALLTSMTGCSVPLTVQAPEKSLTTQELALANAYATLTAQRITVRQMVNRKAITAEQNARVQNRFDAVRKDLDLAVSIVNTPRGQDMIAVALQVLLALEAEYKAKEPK